MELWNEYEGRTIAGTFPLERLLRPEGRSAFFSTSIGNGKGTVIRLIESHYDDDAILARWRAVAGLKQDNLLAFIKFGHVVMDDTSLVYAVMEPVDADLGQILRERPLTLPEAHQLAVSLVSALQALHAVSLVHEHIQPMNVLAVGDTVKLRSDCVRDAPEGAEGDLSRARDIHDLAIGLLQALTLERNPDRVINASANGSALPAPFREIIQNGISGRWTLAQIAQSLTSSVATAAVPAAITHPGAAPSAAPQAIPRASATAATLPPTSTSARPASRTTSASPAEGSSQPSQPPSNPTLPAYQTSASRARVQPGRTTVMVEVEAPPPPRHLRRAALAAAALLVLILILWRTTHRHPVAHATDTTQPMQTLASMGQPANPIARPSADRPSINQTPATRPQSAPPRAPKSQAAPGGLADWRVVAYTYNKQAQAEAKAHHLEGQHPDLQIEVFSPHGRAPYLVALGGLMTRDQAMALKAKLRGQGLPRDLYAQNYRASNH